MTKFVKFFIFIEIQSKIPTLIKVRIAFAFTLLFPIHPTYIPLTIYHSPLTIHLSPFTFPHSYPFPTH